MKTKTVKTQYCQIILQDATERRTYTMDRGEDNGIFKQGEICLISYQSTA